MDRYDLPMIAVIIAFFLFTGVIMFVLFEDTRERNELIAECVHDGNERYECVAMFEKCNSTTAVIPMPVIIGR